MTEVVIDGLEAVKVQRQNGEPVVRPSLCKFDRLVDQRSGTQRVTVISAEPLSEPYAERLTRELERMTGKTVVLERKLDPYAAAARLLDSAHG